MAKSGNKHGGKRPDKLLEESEDERHAFADNSGRFPLDALLRKCGYLIWRRPKNGEPVWMRCGIEIPQREALLRLDPNDVADAKYQQDLLCRGME